MAAFDRCELLDLRACFPWGVHRRPNAPGENGGVANGSFRRCAYSDLADSAADSFGLFPDG
jgi:hypothetical protein